MRIEATSGRMPISLRQISYTTGHVTGCDMFPGRFTMHVLIIKKYIRTKSRQKRPLGLASQEQCLINANSPLSQRQDNALMRRC